MCVPCDFVSLDEPCWGAVKTRDWLPLPDWEEDPVNACAGHAETWRWICDDPEARCYIPQPTGDTIK